MTDQPNVDKDTSKQSYAPQYDGGHPVPTVQGYRALKEEREAEAERPNTPSGDSNASPKSIKSKRKSILTSAKGLLRTGSMRSVSGSTGQRDANPHKAENRNVNGSTSKQAESAPTVAKEEQSQVNGTSKDGAESATEKAEAKDTSSSAQNEDTPAGQSKPSKSDTEDQNAVDNTEKDKDDSTKPLEDTSEATATSSDPHQKRKDMKHRDPGSDDTGREVTDPVTHLRVAIHDSTTNELESAPENIPPPGAEYRSSTGPKAQGKPPKNLQEEEEEQQLAHRGMQKLFPPPDFDSTKAEIAGIYSRALRLAVFSSLGTSLILLVGAQLLSHSQENRDSWIKTSIIALVLVSLGSLSAFLTSYTLRGWMSNRIHSAWEDHVWETARAEEHNTYDSKTPESVQWLNSLLTSLWGLINPDLFTSLMDTVEDVMQASLPKLVRMVSVEDLGQGSESIRILGIRWLPTGAAAQTVSDDASNEKDKDGADSGDDQDEQNINSGMQAEDGDFVNVEIAFSYRASTSGTKLTQKTKNAHLVLAFYLPGGVKLPVWAELKGLIGTVRLRLQLTPDPPFFSLCTLTFLGQPKVDLSCIPLTKKGLNIMDLPLISNFVQSSIDAALASYVAPHSLSLDLKAMLVGDDFKKDTVARGVLMVKIKQGRDFKQGDSSMLGLGEGSSDPYVAVGWAKFGKPVWSTRIIMAEMQPVWQETAFLLVTPEELDAQERLRIQLWDSDRGSADDDLGRIELDLKEIMTNQNSKGKMWDRTDGFQALDDKEKMPGTLDWAVGYFEKSRIQPEQFQEQQVEADVRNLDQLKEKVSRETLHKLREATDRNETEELDQQKAQDLKEREDAMIIATPPLHDHAAGIFAIQIHQITGVEYSQDSKKEEAADDDDSSVGDLPSPYCTIILNHQMIFRTRTKPKNAKPFFNAGTERYIKDWKSTDVLVSVRDSRVHENDALLGIIHLPLSTILKHRAQVIGNYPLVGGLGHGRARISLLFRSVDVQLPKELVGWDYGTLELAKPFSSTDLPSKVHGLRLKVWTTVSRGKLYASKATGDDNQEWAGKRGMPVFLAVRKRYSACVVMEFRKNSIGVDDTVGFGVLWLKDIPDGQDVCRDVTIWAADKDKLKRATANIVEDPSWETLGTLRVPLVFRPGLGPYHKKLASKSPNLQDVFEALQTANENQEIDFSVQEEKGSGSSSDSDSSDSNSDGDSEAEVNDGKGGPIKKLKAYKKHSNQLHRQERGVMQWKGARTADYLKTKAEHSKDHLFDRFRHQGREPGIETEV